MSVDQSSSEHELDQYTRTSIRQALKPYGVAVNDGWDKPISAVQSEEIDHQEGGKATQYDVLVDIAGRLIIEKVMEDQGLLIYLRDGIEIKVKGFQDKQLLLDLIDHRTPEN